MKIAVLISGFVRDIEQSYKEHKFVLENYDCDVYISTWNNLGRKKNQRRKYGDKSTDWIDYEDKLDVNRLISLFNPIAYEIEDIDDFNKKYDDAFIENYLKTFNFNSYSRCRNVIGQFYRIKSLWKLFNTNKDDNVHYDMIMKSRFDNKFPRKINFNSINNDNSMYITDWWGKDLNLDGVKDFCFISSSYETMSIYFLAFDYILTSENMLSDKYILRTQGRSGPVPELIVAHLLRINNITIKNLRIGVDIFR